MRSTEPQRREATSSLAEAPTGEGMIQGYSVVISAAGCVAATFPDSHSGRGTQMSIRVGHGALMALALTAISTVANAQAPNCQALNLNGNFDGRFYEVVSFTGPWTLPRQPPKRGCMGMCRGTSRPSTRLRKTSTCIVWFRPQSRARRRGLALSRTIARTSPGAAGNGKTASSLIRPTPPDCITRTGWRNQACRPSPITLGGSEDHLAIGRYSDFIGWNDEGSELTRIGGYVVEYGDKLAPIAASQLRDPGGM